MRTAVILALAIGSGSYMVSHAEVFSWLRKSLLARATPGRPRWKAWKQVYKLFTCPYCLSVWMSLVASLIWDTRLLPYWYPLGWLATSLAMTTVAMLAVLVVKKALRS